MSTTGQNCINDPPNANMQDAWNEHPTFSPDGSVIVYVSALNNPWNPGPPGFPLLYVVFGQVNVQVPWELAGQSQATVTATIGSQAMTSASNQTTTAQMVNLATYAPAIFSTNGQGSGAGAIADTNLNSVSSSSPTTAGKSIQIYCTGLGPVTNQPATGAPAPISPLAATTTTPTVTIGGIPATVTSSGLVPGTVGLYQVTVQVPWE